MQAPIYFDSRWAGNHGIGRFASELQARLPGVVPMKIIGPKLSVLDPIAISIALAGCRGGCYFSPGFNPPLRSPIPFAFTIHDLVHLQVQEESSALRRAYYASVVRPAARRAMRVLTVSEASRRDIIEWAGLPDASVVVVGNGVSEIFTPESESARGPGSYFLHVGRRAGHKNIRRLLQAFAACRSSADSSLVFTGAPDAETLQAAAALGLLDKVRFEGNVSDEQLATLYRGATALVFPSLQEGFGLPVVEAMACGTPVITSDIASLREIAGVANAKLIDPFSVDSIAAAMDAVALDPGEQERLRANGLARAREFRWPRVAGRVMEAIQP